MKIFIVGSEGLQIDFIREEVSRQLTDLPRLDSDCCSHSVCVITIPNDTSKARSWFKDLANRLSASAKDDNCVAVVASASPELLNPLGDKGAFSSLIAMLVLALPEIRFLFGTVTSVAGENSTEEIRLGVQRDAFRKAHGLHQLFSSEPEALFDGSALREWVKSRIRMAPDTERDGKHLPKRQDLAVGLDEESDYAHLHAYTAYRFGFRAAALTTKAQADFILKSDSSYQQPKIVFEDLFLNLPDASGSYSWLASKEEKCGPNRDKVCQRHKDFPRLEMADFRVVVTSGHRPSSDRWKMKTTDAYIADKRAEGRQIETLHKPHAGIFSIWSKTKLKDRLRWLDDDGRIHHGTGENFIWPPPWKNVLREVGGDDSGGHSAPGILLLIAEHMIDRAERMVADVHTVEDAVRGAVIATDALELLGGKTPTMAISALTLKHQFELMAVLQFAGVEYHFPVQNRIQEIQIEVQAISNWFNQKRRRNASLNAQMSVLNVLVRTFRSYNQFDEEQICMNQVRHTQHTLWMSTTGWGWLFLPILRYGEFLLASFPRFCLALLGWLIFLSLAFDNAQSICKSNVCNDRDLDMNPYWTACSLFLGSNSLGNGHPLWILLSSITVLAGVAHLGIFISHLYTIVSRK